jgi:hypothetical protein
MPDFHPAVVFETGGYSSDMSITDFNAAMEEEVKKKKQIDYQLIEQPQAYINETGPDGFPTGKKILIQGGMEYFNNPSPQTATQTPQNKMPTKSTPYYEEQGQIHTPTVPQTDNTLKTLKLDFINTQPTQPPLSVKIAFKGPINFSIPLPTHKIIITPLLIILISDKRAIPADTELGTQTNDFHTELIMPDGKIFPITPPRPNVVTFDIGVLHCSLFVRLNAPVIETAPPQEIPQYQTVHQPQIPTDNNDEITEDEITQLLS